jgi:hypothetical protein
MDGFAALLHDWLSSWLCCIYWLAALHCWLPGYDSRLDFQAGWLCSPVGWQGFLAGWLGLLVAWKVFWLFGWAC